MITLKNVQKIQKILMQNNIKNIVQHINNFYQCNKIKIKTLLNTSNKIYLK